MLLKTMDENTCNLYLTGEMYAGEDDAALAQFLTEDEYDNVVIHINSVGGDVSAGITMYNLLSARGVTTVAEGFACSAASLVFMAGMKRVMQQSTLLMIHNPWTFACGNAAELRETADTLDVIAQQVAAIYQVKTGLEPEQLKQLLDNESWITPEQAIAWGFATEIGAERKQAQACASAFACIRNALIPPAKPVETPFQRFFKNFS